MKTGPLYAYLKDLCTKAPISAERIQEFGLPGELRFAGGDETKLVQDLLSAMTQLLDKLNETDKIIVKNYVFSGGTATQRLAAAGRELREADLESSSNYTKNHLKGALNHYAEILALELTVLHSSTVIDQPRPLASRWYEVTALVWMLRLGTEDYRRQHWEQLFEIRSTTGDHPIVDIAKLWTGKGYRDGDVEVLSRQQRSAEFIHKCLRVRPETDQALAWNLYLFDLGLPLLPGKREILHYREVLVDTDDCADAIILQDCNRYPALERMEFFIDIPQNLGVEAVEVYTERPLHPSGSGFVPATPATRVSRDEHGLFRLCFKGDELDHQGRHIVRWDDRYKQT